MRAPPILTGLLVVPIPPAASSVINPLPLNPGASGATPEPSSCTVPPLTIVRFLPPNWARVTGVACPRVASPAVRLPIVIVPERAEPVV